MQPAVRREQSEGTPAFIEVGGSSVYKAADVVAPEAESTKAERQSAT